LEKEGNRLSNFVGRCQKENRFRLWFAELKLLHLRILCDDETLVVSSPRQRRLDDDDD
jgi:hypothetical protein